LQGGNKHGKTRILREISDPGKSANSVQPQGKIVTNKIMSPDVVSVVQKCFKIRLQPGGSTPDLAV